MNNLMEDAEFQESLRKEEELSDYIAKGKKKEIHMYHPGNRHIYSKISRKLESVLDRKYQKVLDVGCEFGDFLYLTNIGRELYGIDISEERVKITRERLAEKGAVIEKGIAEQIPYNNGFFDLVIAQSTLHHCMYPDVVLQEAGRVLKDNGTFVLIEGANDLWYRKAVHYFFEKFSRKYEASQFDHHSKNKLEKLLTENNFEIKKEEDVSIPFAWIGRIGAGDKKLWTFFNNIDRSLPETFPWYHLFICEKNGTN
ncbi:MAG: class I SAM-dependent methyltransferase [Candidatus Woesearchaeota archaeon]